MAETGAYEGLAVEVYDHDKAIGRSFGDVEFYRARLEGVAGPILEPACGNGRMMVPLLEAGHEVAGFDLSPQMIARCEANCRARGFAPRLVVAGFGGFDMGGGYAAVVLPVSSFQLIERFDAGLAALRRFADALAPGGKLIIDLFHPPARAVGHTSETQWTLPTGDLITMEARVVETDAVAQLQVSHLRYQRWRTGKLIETDLQRFALRSWGLGEFTLALEACGFGEIQWFGNYRPRPPVAGDKVYTVEAARTAG
jgi:SAM-dependent methyltransferase